MTKQDNIKYCAGLRLSNDSADLGNETLAPKAEIKIGAEVHQDNFDARAELRHTAGADIANLNIDSWSIQTLVVGAKFGDNRIEAGMDSQVPVSKSNRERRGIGAFDDAKMGTDNTHNAYNDTDMAHWYVNLGGIPYLPFEGSLTVVKPDGTADTEYFINANIDSELNLLGEKAEVCNSIVLRSVPNKAGAGKTEIGFISALSAYGLDMQFGYELGNDFLAYNIEKELQEGLKAGFYVDLADDRRKEFHLNYTINESVSVTASVKDDTSGTKIKAVMDFDMEC